MRRKERPADEGPAIGWTLGIGGRIFLWVVLLFLATLVLFVALDIHHELRTALRLGASGGQMAAIWEQTLRLHLVHGGVTILLFGAGIFFVVRRLVTKRIESMVLAVKRFRLGIWKVRIPQTSSDEIEWLAEVFRQLGPHLEQKVHTFIEVDRKATVARLGRLYEDRLTPPAQGTLNLARSMVERERDRWAWLEVQQAAMKILAEMGLLGRPEHPALREITNVDSSPVPGIQGEGPKASPLPGEDDPPAEELREDSSAR